MDIIVPVLVMNLEKELINLVDRYGNRTRSRGMLRTQDEYILVVDAALRDREYNQTYKEFTK